MTTKRVYQKTGLMFEKFHKAKRTIRSAKPEAILQSQCEQYLELLGLEYLHIPNSLWAIVMRSGCQGAINECSDYLKGFPDLIIMAKSRYLAIELKTEIGKVSHAQEQKRKNLDGKIARSFEEFRELVDQFNAYVCGLEIL
jgi:hypothetical protein